MPLIFLFHDLFRACEAKAYQTLLALSFRSWREMVASVPSLFLHLYTFLLFSYVVLNMLR